MSEPPIRLALVGLGKIARDQHVPAVAADPRFVLAASVDPAGGGLDGVPHFEALRALLDSQIAFDAVAVCTPPQLRSDIAREALAAGKHVLLEKPPATTPSEAAGLEERARAAGLTLFAAWHSRFAAGVAPARAGLADRTVRRVEIVWREDVRVWHPGQAWIWDEGGFGVFDPAINAFSILTRIISDGLFVRSAELAFPSNAHTPVAGEIEFSGPAADGPMTCHLDFLRKEGEDWTIEIRTVDGVDIRLERGGSRLFLNGEEQAIEGIGEYPGIYREFADLIDERRSNVDVSTLRLVAVCMLVARRREDVPIFM